MSLWSTRIARDGFESAYGRFSTQGQVERVDASALKPLFVPVLTPAASQLLRDVPDFVRGQLQHYGVRYDESEYTGKGAVLLKKALKAGLVLNSTPYSSCSLLQLDEVPTHIAALECAMHAEWLDSLTPEQLADAPEWAMVRYFVDQGGEPDKTKTTHVVAFPMPSFSVHSGGPVGAVAADVPGLHQAVGGRTVYVGWDKDAVNAAAGAQPPAEDDKEAPEQTEREQQRNAVHQKYLATTKGKGKAKGTDAPDPVGKYIVDCEAIEENWPDSAQDMTMSIQRTRTAGVYQAHFDFGILEGMMMLSEDRAALAPWAEGADDDDDDEDEDDEDEDDEDEDEDDDERVPTGSKRKPPARGPPSAKVAKTTSTPTPNPTPTYFIIMKSRETGEGEINPDPERGSMTLTPASATITGRVDMSVVGDQIPFTARKVSNVPGKSREKWENFSWAQHQYENEARWG